VLSEVPQDTASDSEDGSDAEVSDRPLAAVVSGEPIYLVDYERMVAQYETAMISSGVDFSTTDGQARLLQAREDILNSMIEQVLIEQYALQQGIVVTDEDVQVAIDQIVQDVGGEAEFQVRLEQNGITEQDMWNDLRAQLIGAKVVEQVTSSVPETADHVHARHIYVDTREGAEQLLTLLQGGADFAELAQQHSQDESTRRTGGDLGFFPRGVLMVPEVEEAAFGLQPQQISGVIASSFGYHIVEVLERDPSRALSPENLQHLKERAFQDWIESLWAQAEIERYVGQNY
jgi:parvulin-like peptidyl-prolyl isomerase